MLALLQGAANQAPGWLYSLWLWLGIFESVAVILGVGAAFWKFIIRNPHEDRLQPTVKAVADIYDEVIYIRVTALAENNGEVRIALDGAVVEPWTRKSGDPQWDYQGPFNKSVFLERNEIRPQEEAEDQVWIEIPYGGEIGLKLDFTVTAKTQDTKTYIEQLFTRSEEDEAPPKWSTNEIVSLLPEEGTIPSQGTTYREDQDGTD